MKKKIGAFGAGQFSLGTLVGGRPVTTIFQNLGGGWGVSHTRTGPGRPPGEQAGRQGLVSVNCQSFRRGAACGWGGGAEKVPRGTSLKEWGYVGPMCGVEDGLCGTGRQEGGGDQGNNLILVGGNVFGAGGYAEAVRIGKSGCGSEVSVDGR